MTDEKVHKPKGGPSSARTSSSNARAVHPLLALRALLRRDHRHRRAGIFERGDHWRIGLFPGPRSSDNKLSANVVDICSRRALTDRDFRFQVRVWYLDTVKSICPGCAAALQHRGPREPAPSHPPMGAASRAQAALQRRGQQMVDPAMPGRYGSGFRGRRGPASRSARRQQGGSSQPR